MATFVLKTAGHCRVATEDYIATTLPRLPYGSPFADLGETELRGFEDPVRLFEVRWQK